MNDNKFDKGEKETDTRIIMSADEAVSRFGKDIKRVVGHPSISNPNYGYEYFEWDETTGQMKNTNTSSPHKTFEEFIKADRKYSE